MKVDIISENSIIGSLEIFPEGLYTVFSTRLPKREGLWRLWLTGERPYPLSLMEPGENSLRLRRRLSREQMKKLPPFSHAELLPAEKSPGIRLKAPRIALAASMEAASAEPAPRWLPRRDGTYIRNEPTHSLIAIPCAEELSHPALRTERIGGRKYIVFYY